MTKIIGHRGAAGLALENSLASIRAALKLPIDGIELDVRRTEDGQLVLMHDFDIGRVASNAGWVEHTTLKELRALRLINGEPIPTLEEAFRLIGNKKLIDIDIKSTGMVRELLHLLKAYPKVRVVCSGRRYTELYKLHLARPDIPIILQHHYDPFYIVHRAKRLGASGICVNMWLMNPITYYQAKRQGLIIYAYTINRPWLLGWFKRLYPSAWIISNHPERLVEDHGR